MITKAGTYKARAVEVMLGMSKEKGTPFVGVTFRILEGDGDGKVVKWAGFLSDKASASGKTVAERTIESLQYCGWRGDDISEFRSGLHGLDANPVDLVIEMEPGFKDPTKLFPKVAWVNRHGGGASFAGEAMDAAQAAQFGQKYRGLALTLKAKSGQTPTPPPAASSEHVDDMPF